MHTNFYQALKDFEQIKEVELPPALHGRIMRSLYLRQFRLPLVVINVVLFVNFSISAYHMGSLMAPRMQALLAPGGSPALARGGEQFTAFFQNLFAALPFESGMVFGINLALLGTGLYLLHRLRALMLMARISPRK